MSTYLVQGMGCAESGARVVMGELLKNAPEAYRFIVLCTSRSARDLIGKRVGVVGGRILIVGLNHNFFGRWLRVPLELTIGIMAVLRVVSGVVNLSHYGWCLGGWYALYIHSPLVMESHLPVGKWRDGNSNPIKRALLRTCVKRASVIVVQTQQMADKLVGYCAREKLKIPAYRVMRPDINLPTVDKPIRRYQCQLFYPTSRFEHKRARLAIAGILTYNAMGGNAGLVITLDSEEMGKDNVGISFIGSIPRQEVFRWIRGSEVMLFTSERETLGLPLLEALRLGVPVIAPRLSYAIEILQDAGVYFDEPTPEGVAQAISYCFANYAMIRARVVRRSAVIAAESRDWRSHWAIFLGDADVKTESLRVT